MGCRCCKMIQSYIFDPQEVQTSDYISEINNHKLDEQDGGKFKNKHNDIQVHKNQLQNSEVQSGGNRNKLNNTKDAFPNRRGTALHEEGLENSTEKCNGIHSYPILNTNHSRETSSTHTCSHELSSSSAKRVPQPQTYNNHETLKTEGAAKLSSGTAQTVHHEEFQCTGKNASPIQGAIEDGQGSDSHLPGLNDPGDPGKRIAIRSKNPLSHHTHGEQSTECTAVRRHSRDLPSQESKSCDSGGKACRTGLLNPCFEDKMSIETPSSCTKTDATSEAKYDSHEEVNGELEEEEDADVAEALAALEAATAGEDSEEEED